ncbi:hypothetical protein BDV29DRAFT_159318 [Aspergillus leporis]|uniref:Uncharacterized protein n=1 Tax=Aspergillus leporis TaxID=41062 RepID=A0A5N5WV33_9EURO|nr:hypothetical protein BDV29DRAFT_159318 [Aspergillus leporis]
MDLRMQDLPASSYSGKEFWMLSHSGSQSPRYDVSFIGGAEFEGAVQRTGATFFETENTFTPDLLEEEKTLPEGPPHFIWGLEKYFIDSTPTRMRTLQAVLEKLREQHPGGEVIIVQETMYMGTWPFVLGAALPRGNDRLQR